MNNLTGSEQVALLGVIAPGALAAQAHTSAWIDTKNFENILIIIQTGTLGAAATVDAAVTQATSVAGAGSKAVTGKAITQLVKATNDDDQVMINLRQQDLDVSNRFRWIQLTITIAAAASGVSAVILGLGPRYGPATLNDVASVVQIVT